MKSGIKPITRAEYSGSPGIMRAILVILVLLTWSGFADGEPGATDTTGARYRFEIDEPTLGGALAVFARQGQVQMLYPYHLADSVEVNPVKGVYTIRTALEILLRGTGFTGDLTQRGIVTVSRTDDRENAENTREKPDMNIQKKSGLLAGLAALLLGGGEAAGAQESAQRAPASAVFEEIVVTAQKREARLQDVPVTVSALSGSAIERLGATDFKDVLRYIPGVSYSGEEHGQSKYNIRGVSTTSTSPTVGVYLDDISLLTVATNFSGSADPVFFDFERLEVLKGPQGTLYGGNAMGGAIKYVSRKPSLEGNEFVLAGGLAGMEDGDASWETEGIFNLALLDDVLAIRGGLLYRERGGYIDQAANAPVTDWRYSQTSPPEAFSPVVRDSLATRSEDDHNDSEIRVGRLSLLWTPDETLSVIPLIFAQRYEQSNTNSFRLNLDEMQTSNRFEEPGEDNLDVASLTITKAFDAFTLTSLTGYMDRGVAFERDYSFFVGGLVPAVYPLDSYNVSKSDTTNYTQEFRLASDFDGSAWQWVAGVFYSYQEDTLFQQVETGGAGDAFDTGTDIVYVGDTETETHEYALFGELTYSVTSKLDATLGLRYFSIDQEVNAAYDGIFNGGSSAVNGAEQEETGLNPKFSLVYQIADENMAYATASKGFRQGGPNRFAFDPNLCRADLERLGIDEAPESFESDEIWTYELGSKNRFGNGLLTLNGSLYFTDWKNIQQTIELTGCGFNFTGNVGAAEVRGAEMEMQLNPTERLSFVGAVAYTDAEITESSPGVSAREGQQVLDVPEWTMSLSASYTVPLTSGWRSIVQLDYQYRGSSYRTFNELFTTTTPDGTPWRINDPTRKQDSYDISNAYLMLENDRWEYKLYIKNLFDESPILDYALDNVTHVTTIRPRTYDINVRVYF